MEIDFRKKRYVLDGGMGTMLQSAGMSPEETTTEFGLAHPEILTQILVNTYRSRSGYRLCQHLWNQSVQKEGNR